MADRFMFTGSSQTGYLGYRDQDTQKMLTAEPGGDYAIAAINPADPVPPQDGRWEPAPDGLPPPLVQVALVPPAPEPETGSDDTESGEQQ